MFNEWLIIFNTEYASDSESIWFKFDFILIRIELIILLGIVGFNIDIILSIYIIIFDNLVAFITYSIAFNIMLLLTDLNYIRLLYASEGVM